VATAGRRPSHQILARRFVLGGRSAKDPLALKGPNLADLTRTFPYFDARLAPDSIGVRNGVVIIWKGNIDGALNMAVSVKMIESVIRHYFAPCRQAGARKHCLLCRCLSVVDAIESADDKDGVRLYIKDSEPILSANIDAKLQDNRCRMFPIRDEDC